MAARVERIQRRHHKRAASFSRTAFFLPDRDGFRDSHGDREGNNSAGIEVRCRFNPSPKERQLRRGGVSAESTALLTLTLTEYKEKLRDFDGSHAGSQFAVRDIGEGEDEIYDIASGPTPSGMHGTQDMVYGLFREDRG